MNDLIVILLIFMIFLLSVLIALIAYFGYRYFVKSQEGVAASVKKNDTKTTTQKPHDPVKEVSHCPNHKDNSPVGTCLICEEAFCEECLIEHESVYFCKEHFRTFVDYKWERITDILTTPDKPETAEHVYKFKREIWTYEKIPTYVLTHYKININNDHIESYVQLHVREADKEKLSLRLENLQK